MHIQSSNIKYFNNDQTTIKFVHEIKDKSYKYLKKNTFVHFPEVIFHIRISHGEESNAGLALANALPLC